MIKHKTMFETIKWSFLLCDQFFCYLNRNIDNRSNVLHSKNDMNAKQKHADWIKLSLLK